MNSNQLNAKRLIRLQLEMLGQIMETGGIGTVVAATATEFVNEKYAVLLSYQGQNYFGMQVYFKKTKLYSTSLK